MVHSKSLATAQCERNIQQQALEKQKHFEELERARDEARLADFEAEKHRAERERNAIEAEILSRQCSANYGDPPRDAADATYKIVSRTLGSSRKGGH